MDELITYMGYLWLQVDGDVITIGVNEDGLEELDEIDSIDLPAENSAVAADEACGEVNTANGPMNIYSPVDGKVVEVNEAVTNEPSLIQEDNFGDGWLIRIEAKDPAQVEALVRGASEDSDEDDEDEEDEEEEREE